MAANSVIIDIGPGGIATMTMNRPEVHNAFDEDLIEKLYAGVKALDGDPSVRIVVLAAAGKSFSAGADLNWMKRMAEFSEAQNKADAENFAGLLKSLNGLTKPTIAAVQGAAYGGGVGLISCCDIAIAVDTAQFSISEVKLGLIPAVISPYVIAAIGERQAGRYMLSAERFHAQEARRIGLVHEVVAADDLDGVVKGFADQLLENGPGAMAEVKDLIANVAHRSLDDGLMTDTAARIARVRASEEGREGVGAFLEKRKPGWTEK
ncbi:MAG: enoyl-CoA hydratase/isomerase family protein [Rhodospirillales bacterium]|nr:enoyl-CoA hydratase/isomerase family protein [Rhodospirillales bacterium]